ncbi:ABC-type hemin transport system, ATPase component [Methylophaga frappieri]|uniref:ABC-type hemin transport system, ATPase component n=1 Tax=Methylophaga frappieri (strain ATCC BAA-2434 / DSM 25690 / JAM7) TaxID=754477 RepID=I1YJ02_METFJ|nr:heme ABC transporter ATP-binding protein [Methylophaga frappieri]AFJ02895.1 ABC-type hemin transport system, ATPase component [Methylophaga frappieri]
MALLDIHNLHLQRSSKTILHIEQASLNTAEIVAVLGPNGAGKSSLLKILASQWQPESGHILFHNTPLQTLTRRDRAQHIGVLPQSSELNFPFRAQEVVAIGATPLSMDKHTIDQQTRHWMQKTATLTLADRLYTSLSGGERQRVQLARVLLQISMATRAPLLLLDEPTSAQDLGQQHDLLAMLRELTQQQQATILMIMHDLNLAGRYADQIWLLNQGKMVASGRPDAILHPDRVKSVWGYYPEVLQSRDGRQVLV